MELIEGFVLMILMETKIINGKRNLLIREYPPPSTLEDLLDLAEALIHFRNQNPIVLGDLNDDIQDQNPRRQQVGELLMEFGLVDL